MCTVTWWQRNAEYGLLFNRDESRRRLEAINPAVQERGSCKYLCPIDGDAGGTWLWVNEYGLITRLLNYYIQDPLGLVNPVSRGLLLKSLADRRNLSGVERKLEASDLGNYKPFMIFSIIGIERGLYIWDGRNLEVRRKAEFTAPLSSSGFLPDDVIPYRKNLFSTQVEPDVPDIAVSLEKYHCSHDPAKPAHSVLMSRPDARTVSLSQVMVDKSRIRFLYNRVLEDCSLGPASACEMGRRETESN